MRWLLVLIVAASLAFGAAQVDALAAEAAPLDVAGAHLPLVSAGTVLRWTPHVDDVFFDLPGPSWVRLSVYSPSVDLDEVGDERYDDRRLEAAFRLLATDGPEGGGLLAEEAFALTASDWRVLYDGPAGAGGYRIESEVVGHGKNVYLLRLETELDGVTLVAPHVTVNVSRRDWHPAMTFEIDAFARCELGMYDGDGDDELEARLVLPSGVAVRPVVSDDLAWSYQPLPRLLGLYTVQTRIPEGAFQATNAVRFDVHCNGTPVPLALVPALTLLAPEPGAIVVEVVDLQGRPLDIGYRLEGRFERVVVLDEDDAYHLVAIETRGGEVRGAREVAFGPAGGFVRYVLDRARAALEVAVPGPGARVELAPPRPVPIPPVQARVAPQVPVPLPVARVELAPLRAVPLPSPRVVVVPALSAEPPAPVDQAHPVPLPGVRVELAPLRAVPSPRVVVVSLVPSAARLELDRELSPAEIVPCQVVDVRLLVRNVGDLATDYTLHEHLPVEVAIEAADGAGHDAGGLVWSGRLEAGGVAEHRYRLRVGGGSAETLPLRGELRWDDAVVTDEAALRRRSITLELVRRPADGAAYVDDVVEVDARVVNPLDGPVTVQLVPEASSRLALIDGPRRVTLPAGGSVTVTYRLRGLESGAAAFQLGPTACDPGATDEVPAGAPARTPWTLTPLPSLPEAVLSTAVTVDVAARRLPTLEGLVVVARPPEGASYRAGSARLDTASVPDPVVIDGALVFRVEARSDAQLVYTLLHTSPLAVRDVDHALIALTPLPELLVGDAGALDIYQRTVLDGAAAGTTDSDDVGPRDAGEGLVLLAPLPNTVVRGAPTVAVVVAAPVDAAVAVFVDGVEVPADRLAEARKEPASGRQTLRYLGVPLQPGPNLLRVEASAADGGVEVDERVVFRAGTPATIAIVPLGHLLADTIAPLRFAIDVRDAWGHPPRDGVVTVDVAGALVSGRDADPQRAGHQVAFRDGRGTLELAPLDRAGDVTVVAAVGLAHGEGRFEVVVEPRPWIVAGMASFGVAYGPGGGRLGGSGSAFARGAVFGDASLTVALRVPLTPLGQPEAAPPRFGVVGSSGPASSSAASRHGVFLRLERRDDFVQYGDFVTGFRGAFQTDRSYTGLSGSATFGDGALGLQAYAAYVAVDDQVEGLELPSDGTSVYRLPGAPLRPGSLRLEVIKRDRMDARLRVEDEDPWLRVLTFPADFVVDEGLGLVTLARPLPLGDAAGNPYLLRAAYAVLEVDAALPGIQAGVQAQARVGGIELHAAVSQETHGFDGFERLASVGGVVEGERLSVALDAAYGQDEDVGGFAFAADVRYASDRVQIESGYRFFGVGFRSDGIESDDDAGHAGTFGVAVALLPEVALRGSLRLRHATLSGDVEVDGRLLASYQGGGAWTVAARPLGTRPSAQLGVQMGDRGVRAVGSIGLRDVVGVAGSDVRVTHLQGLDRSTTSITDLSVGLRLADALELRLTDRHVWGQGHALLVGLQSSFENAALVQAACLAGGCAPGGPLPLGRSTVIAQYEMPGGVSMEAGRMRLGVDARLPLGDHVRVEGSATRVVDLAESARSATLLAAGIVYDTDPVDAAARYEVRVASEGVKQVAHAGITGAFGDAFVASVQARYLHDPAAAPSGGFAFSVAAAYRGDRVSVLTEHRGRLGSLQAQGGRELDGDTRVTWTVSRGWELRAGHAYQLLPGDGFVDLWSLGVTAHPWDGGSVSAYGRWFYDRGAGVVSPGIGLEAAQALGCGLYGVAGVNAWDGDGADRGAAFGQPGVYLRLDVVFDENWRCGARAAPEER